MAVLVPTVASNRHILGDYAVRHFTLTGNNGDTLTVPQFNIAFLAITPTTAISVGATISGSTITFVTSGAWTAIVAVFARIG